MRKIVNKVLRKIEGEFNEAQKYSKHSWSQQGEDVLIDFYFKWELQKPNPSYLDIGANHPFYLNNTYLFYENGANGVTVEPNTILFDKLTKTRRNDIHLNCGIGRESGEFDFYSMQPNTLSTFSEEEANKMLISGYATLLEKKKIKIQNINTILDKYFLNNENYFISIDVEGLDHEILSEIDFKRHRPSLLCVELPISVRKDFEKYLSGYNYEHYASNSTNVIYIKK